MWMRNAHIAVYAFMSVCALSGLCFVFYSAFVGQVLRAIGGALIAMGGITVGFLSLAAVRFGAVLVARTERIERLIARVEAVENSLETQGVPIDLSRVGTGNPEKLVAANVPRDGFPRLVRHEPLKPPAGPTSALPNAGAAVERRSREEHQWQLAYQNGDIAACRRTLDRLRELLEPERIVGLEEGLLAMGREKAAQLREDFGKMVRSRNYEAALMLGEQIAELFPESAMACEFQTIRPHLTERAEQQKEPQSVSAVMNNPC